jgi:penicillin-binding protein 1C
VAAALVRAPNAKPAQVVQRACAVLQSLAPLGNKRGTGMADCEALDLFTTAVLQRRDYAASEGIAPHVARQLSSARAASPTPAARRIQTSLSAPLQRFATQTLQQHLRELSGRHVEDGALVVLDNATGEVLAWVGSSGALSNAAEVDGVTALRQPGSTLKPFLFGQAIAERRITAASLLEDSGAQIQTSAGLYIPQNYDHQFKGWVSARTALGASLNVPAVRTLVMVSPDAFQKQLVRLGLPFKESGDFYGYSLALGSAEVSLLNLTNAYRALANGGRTSPTSLATGAANKKPAPQQALDPRAAFIVGDILSDPYARARTFGTDSVLATRFWSAVKTGTSKDMRDNWAMGWSQRYTVGVWVGNASGAPMWDVSGTTGAAPIWAAMMNHLHAAKPSRPPKPPAGVVQAAVQFADPGAKPGSTAPLEAARLEWFVQGTQQTTFAMNSVAHTPDYSGARGSKGLSPSGQQAVARITAPTTGTIIALDPDIPPKHQRVSFAAQGSNLRWLMDGKPFAKGPSAQWLPWPGRHVVQIVDAKGQVLDEVRLEVRGAGVAGKR